MDKVTKYKAIVRAVINEVGTLGKLPNEQIETQFITDDEHGHYLLYFNGWKGEKRTYGCFLHIDVKDDGKVWLQFDGTDLKVAQELVEKGIPRTDIVLGFHAPYKRPLTDFAVA